MSVYLKKVKTLESKYVRNLVNILNNDKKLIIEKLGGGENDKILSCDEFAKQNAEWAEKNKGEIFAMILDNEAIGLISLSRIDKEAQTARIGYFITSKYWERGYDSDAFEQMLNLAREKNIKVVSGSILKQDVDEKELWKRFNAEFEDKGESLVSHIYL